MKISKWVMALLGALYVLNAVLFVMSGNWSALIWEIGSIVLTFSYESVLNKKNKYIERTDEVLDELMNDYIYMNFVIAERRAACAEENVRRYQLENQQLRAEKEQLKILNHNLLCNQGKGVKNYARKQNTK
jgi:hypothetical protein